MRKYFQNKYWPLNSRRREFSGSQTVRTPCFQCRVHRSDPLLGSSDPISIQVWPKKKPLKNNKEQKKKKEGNEKKNVGSGQRCEVSMLKARNVFVPGNIGENKSSNSDFSSTEKQILSFQVCKT